MTGTKGGVRAVAAALGAAVVMAAPARPAAAQQQVFTAQLTPGQQVNPVVSSGSGFATLTLMNGTMLNVSLTFQNLTSSSATAPFAHIHAGKTGGPGSNATVAVGFVNFPVGVTSGAYNNTFDLTALGTYNPAWLTENNYTTADAARLGLIGFMTSGLAYVNVHTPTYGAGEIRGQVSAAATAVPEPGTYALVAAGLGGAGLLARRRRA